MVHFYLQDAVAYALDEFADHAVPRAVVEHGAVLAVLDRSDRVVDADALGHLGGQVGHVALVLVVALQRLVAVQRVFALAQVRHSLQTAASTTTRRVRSSSVQFDALLNQGSQRL